MRALSGTVAAVLLALVATGTRAHDGLPVVVNIEERAAGVYLLGLIMPPTVPAQVRPTLVVTPACAAATDSAPAASAAVPGLLLRCADGIGGKTLTLQYLGGRPAVATLARVAWLSGEVRSVLAEPGRTTLELPRPESAPGVLRDYFALGVRHILEGWDHLLFLVCLLIIARTPRRVLLTVTGFTLGHATTITLASLGIAGLPGPPVEASIALSIMFLASEIVRPHRDTLAWRHPVTISAAFGLLHGFGFAGALRDIGLPQTEVPMALLGFNLGIEAGQLVFVLACGLLVAVLVGVASRRGRTDAQLARLATAAAWAAGIVAAYWFVDRSVGLVA